MSIDFKGSHYPKDVILYAVFFYVRYAVSHRDLEGIMAERGIQVDHATAGSWRMPSRDIAAQYPARWERDSAYRASWFDRDILNASRSSFSQSKTHHSKFYPMSNCTLSRPNTSKKSSGLWMNALRRFLANASFSLRTNLTGHVANAQFGY